MNIQQALVAAYNSRDDVAFDRLTEQVMKRVTDLEKECQAVGKQLDQYDEFGCVYDPEGPLPTLAEKVHGTIVELQEKAKGFEDRLKGNDMGRKQDDIDRIELLEKKYVELLSFADSAVSHLTCENLHHNHKQRHGVGELCPVLVEYQRRLASFATCFSIPSQNTPAKQESVQEK